MDVTLLKSHIDTDSQNEENVYNSTNGDVGSQISEVLTAENVRRGQNVAVVEGDNQREMSR